jgi:hypothetical protein
VWASIFNPAPCTTLIHAVLLILLSFSLLQLLCGWHSNSRVQEPGVYGGSLSKKPADEDLLESMECWWLGYKRWLGQDRLGPGSFHRFL